MGEVRLHAANIGGGVDLSGIEASNKVNLTGAAVNGELRLGPSSNRPARWLRGSTLILRNASVGAVQDADESDCGGAANCSWPPPGALRLAGFTYERLGGQKEEGSGRIMARRSASYVDWLGRDKEYSSQPYQHLAMFLRASGDEDRADAVLYASRERQRAEAWQRAWREGAPMSDRINQLASAAGLFILKWTIGYGLGGGYWRAVVWAAVISGFGAWLLWHWGDADTRRKGRVWCWWASVDRMLPFLTLNEENRTVVTALPDWRLQWFHFQALMGLRPGGLHRGGPRRLDAGQLGRRGGHREGWTGTRARP